MEVTIAIIILFVIWGIYQRKYYKSEEFKKIKFELNDYITECNELNSYIESLKQKHYNSISDKINYGEAKLIDNSKYKYKRSEQVNFKKTNFVYECSNSVCKNASRQPFKYLCKYFNIPIEEETLVFFESMLNDFISIKEGKEFVKNKLQLVMSNVKNNLPFLIRNFGKTRFIRELGYEPIDMREVYIPTYSFVYISAGGNKRISCDIVLDINNLNNFIKYLSDSIKWNKSVKKQRALMTPKLREEIKQRDEYTCQHCGNSISKEPNLLLEIDHIKPLSKGGLTTSDNLQTLCWKCNRSKGNKYSN